MPSKKEIIKASMGYTRKNGGLNVKDMREYLNNQGLRSDGNRYQLEQKIKQVGSGVTFKQDVEIYEIPGKESGERYLSDDDIDSRRQSRIEGKRYRRNAKNMACSVGINNIEKCTREYPCKFADMCFTPDGVQMVWLNKDFR